MKGLSKQQALGIRIAEEPEVVRSGFIGESKIIYGLVAALLLTLMQYSSIMALNSQFDLIDDLQGIGFAAAIVSALIVLILMWDIPCRYTFGILGVMYVLWVVQGLWPRNVLTPLRYLVDCFAEHYSAYYTFSWSPMVPAGLSLREEQLLMQQMRNTVQSTLFFVMLPLWFAAGYALLKKYIAIFAYGGMLLVCATILTSGYMIPMNCLLMMLVTAFTVYLISVQKKLCYGKIPVPLLLSCLAVSVLIVAIGFWGGQKYLYPKVNDMVIPIQNYVYTTAPSQMLEDIGAALQLRGGRSNKGGISMGQLGSTGRLQYNNTTDLHVSFNDATAGYLYLKGYVGEEYTGREWKNVEKAGMEDIYQYGGNAYDLLSPEYYFLSEFSFLSVPVFGSFVSMVQSPPGYPLQIGIYNVDKSSKDISFFPYQSFLTEEDGEVAFEAYLKGDMQKSSMKYFDTYYVDSDVILNAYDRYTDWTGGEYIAGPLGELELQYWEKIYEYYLQVPDTVVLLRQEMEGVSFDHYTDAVNYVRQFLFEKAEYSLNPGAIWRGEDFVDIFLYTKKQGYCMHFATAATVMFRLLGIPARYVEGYICPPQKKAGMIEIKDSQAHAWTEIYLEGYGWLPVEVTPGYGDVPTSVVPKPSETPEETETEMETEGPSTSEEETETAEETETETNTDIETGTESGSSEQEASASQGETEENSSDNRQEETSENTETEPGAEKTEAEPSGGTGQMGSLGNNGSLDTDRDETSDDSENPSASSEFAVFVSKVWEVYGTVIVCTVLLIILLFSLIAVIRIRRNYCIAVRQKSFRDEDARKALLAIYAELVKVLALDGFRLDVGVSAYQIATCYFRTDENWETMLSEFMDAVSMAMFSSHEITREQCQDALLIYQRLVRAVGRKVTGQKKILYQWVYCF